MGLCYSSPLKLTRIPEYVWVFSFSRFCPVLSNMQLHFHYQCINITIALQKKKSFGYGYFWKVSVTTFGKSCRFLFWFSCILGKKIFSLFHLKTIGLNWPVILPYKLSRSVVNACCFLLISLGKVFQI